MRYLAVVALVIGLLTGRVLASSQVWVKLPPASWSASQIEAFLDDSPWAGRANVQRAARFAYPKHKAVVTWESAPLVRQARVRSGRGLVNAASAQVPSYTVSVRLWGTARALELMGSPRILLQRMAMLRRSGKADLTPIDVEAFLVDERGAVITPIPVRDRMDVDGGVTHDACGNFRGRMPGPLPPGVFEGSAGSYSFRGEADRIGNGYLVRDDLPCKTALVFAYRFPASDAIAVGEQVEFAATLGPQTVTRTFEVSKMVVNGNLDLR